MGDNFNDIKYSCADRILSFQVVNSHVAIHDVTVTVGTLILFGVSVVRRSNNELRACMKFELASYIVSLSDKI